MSQPVEILTGDVLITGVRCRYYANVTGWWLSGTDNCLNYPAAEDLGLVSWRLMSAAD
tara:strand:- start:1 stop:174 length:174 start_codon:yes stop_codon:yes gene_type:complete